MLDAASSWSPVRQSIVDAVRGASTAEQTAARLAEWSASHAADETIARSIYEPSVQSDLAGQLFVRLIEVGDAKRLLADDPRDAFLRMSFDEAIAFWRERGGDPAILERVMRAYRRQAASATSLAVEALARRAQSEIERALTQGGGVGMFVDAMNAETDSLGISPANPTYLETVFRTNVATAYGAGRFRQLTDPVVVAARPYRQYRASGDGRTRPNHRALDKLIFDAASTVWLTIAPPNGFNCRCAMVSLDEEDYLERGGTLTTAIPAGAGADPGWNRPPTLSI